MCDMTDYSEFIDRHHNHKPKSGNQERIQMRRRLIMAMIIMIMYATVVAFIIQAMNYDEVTIMVSALVFVSATIIAFVAKRVQSQQMAQEKELILLKEVLESSRGGRLITDANGKTLYYNQRLAQMSPTDTASFEHLLDMFSGNPQAKPLMDDLADKAHRGLTDSIELYCDKQDYEGCYQLTAHPVAGHLGIIHWRLDNVTTTHAVAEQIREEREKLIDFTDNAPVGFFSLDETGKIIFANATFARWIGVDLNDILGHARLHTYFISPPKNAKPYDLIERGGETQIAEIEMKGAAGRTFLASINQTIVKTSDKTIRTRAVIHDITAEREMRRALKASEDRFKKFYDEAPLGIILVNKDGLVEECNAEFARMIGQNPENLENKHFKLLITEHDRKAVIKALKKAQDGETIIESMEVTLHGENDTLVNTELHARRFSDNKGIVFHFIDITEKKSLEQQFVQSQKMQAVGQLAGGIAHDFNNLLTAMIGFCDLLLLRHKPGDPSFGDIMQIKQNSNRAANLVRQLLAFSRQQTLRQRVHDITDILTELSHLLRRLIGAGVDLDMIHGSDLGLVKVDEGQMEQVLINLAVNARDAMNGNGKLTITTENFTNRKTKKVMEEGMPPGHWIVIKVTDTGCGISQENMSRILEPFFTTKDVGQGTGLGLATVYGIIRQSDGFLDIESKLGKGTTFSIYLPKAKEAEEEEMQSPEIVSPKDLTGSECILLVEDEDAVRTFAQRALTNKGYEVLCAEHGESALEIFKKQKNRKIDLLITDVVMPGMDGPTLAQKIRAQSPNLKIIFMSGYTEDKLKDYMGENIYFLPKPFTLKVLASKVKEVLEG